MAYLFDESFRRTRVLIANCFEIEIHSSGAKFLRFLDFQAITLDIRLDFVFQSVHSYSLFVLCSAPKVGSYHRNAKFC